MLEVTPLLLVLAAFLALLLSALSSGTETGVYCLNRVRLRLRAEHDDVAARTLARLMAHPEELVVTALLGTNVADYLVTISVTALLLHSAIGQHAAELYATLIVTPAVLVFGGVVPKDWFRRDSERLMYALALPLSVARRVAAGLGLIWLLRGLARWAVRTIDPSAAPEVELLPRSHTLQLLREGAVRGGLSDYQRDTIERVLNLSAVRVGSVMIPRARVASVPVDVPREDFLRIARMAHFSRLPVWRENPKRVIGVVNVYDVLIDDEGRAVTDHVRPALRLHAHESVPAALRRLQHARQAMAIVVDRWDNCIGILTVKDLVEEIVGDLAAW